MCYISFAIEKTRHINTYQPPVSDGFYAVDVAFMYNRSKVTLPDWAQIYMLSARPYGDKRPDYDR